MEIIDSIYNKLLETQPVLQGYVLCLCIPRLIYREGAWPRVRFEVQFGWQWIHTTLCFCTQPVRRIVYCTICNMPFTQDLYPRSSDGLESWEFVRLCKAQTGERVND